MLQRILLISGLVFMSLCSSASAQQLDNIYKDWSVFTLRQRGEKICYIASAPVKKSGNYKKRGEPYLIVTHRSAKVDEVSTSAGYPFKTDGKITVRIDNKDSFDMFTSTEVTDVAWARDTTQDAKIVEAMKDANNVTIRGNSQVDTYSEDRYSLAGFTQAYQRMKALCGRY
jgi:invasion protein IalB